jgi:hypothetical protein
MEIGLENSLSIHRFEKCEYGKKALRILHFGTIGTVVTADQYMKLEMFT